MKFRYETFEEKEKRLGKWHMWFAWYPVKSDNHWVWLERVARKKYWWPHIGLFSSWCTKYCTKTEFERLLTKD